MLTFGQRRHMRRQLRSWRQQAEWSFPNNYFEDSAYIECVEDILRHPVFCSMVQYIQHGATTTREHCISVSYLSYTLALMFHADARACARAGLLHDMFLYDWHTYKPKKGERLHGFTHARTAHDQACRYFQLSEVERNCILRHMWPLNIVPPKYFEGYIVTYADKYCSALEIIAAWQTQLRRLMARV